MSFIRFCVAPLLALSMTCMPGWSADNEFCQRYATMAVSQYLQNVQYRCGFKDGRWHRNAQAHFRWCLATSRDRASAEREARQKALRRCRSGKKYGQRDGFRCETYARKAVEQNRSNIRKGCGFTGGRWHASFQVHKHWCLDAAASAAQAEDAARTAELQKCHSCRDYARKAVEHHRANLQRTCGNRSGRWHGSVQRHVQWCPKVSERTAKSETSARLKALGTCGNG